MSGVALHPGAETEGPTRIPCPSCGGAITAFVPGSVTLLQNVPNPFNPKTEIRFGLPAAATADLKVYDTTGRLVRTLLDGAPYGAGFHRVSWDGTDDRGQRASTGVYFYVLETGAERQHGKMLLLK